MLPNPTQSEPSQMWPAIDNRVCNRTLAYAFIAAKTIRGDRDDLIPTGRSAHPGPQRICFVCTDFGTWLFAFIKEITDGYLSVSR
jgi:hypothetical protein